MVNIVAFSLTILVLYLAYRFWDVIEEILVTLLVLLGILVIAWCLFWLFKLGLEAIF